MLNTSCALAGGKFSCGTIDSNNPEILTLITDKLSSLVSAGIINFYTGMNRGADLLLAELVLELKQQHPNVSLTAVLPCETQASGWLENERDRYFNILPNCDDVVTLSARYTPVCYFERNRYLVERAEHLLGISGELPDRNVSYMIRYAERLGRKITILYPNILLLPEI